MHALAVLPFLVALTGPDAFRDLHDRYVRFVLAHNPVVCTYLGGAGLYPELAATGARLRDYRAAALAEETAFYQGIRKDLDALPAEGLTPDQRIDAEVLRAQIDFMVRLTTVRRHQEVSVDTYTNEPPRGIDWQIQGMRPAPAGGVGTEAEWDEVIGRVAAVPAYLAVARVNLEAGLKRQHWPDWRQVERDGIAASEANATYFAVTLPAQAGQFLARESYHAAVTAKLTAAGRAAGAACAEFARFLDDTFREGERGKRTVKESFKADRFALGLDEYEHALRQYLRLPWGARELFEYGRKQVHETQAQLTATAKAVAQARGLPWSDKDADAARASVRGVLDALARGNSPKDDTEMVAMYRKKALELVAYGRAQNLFELPADYKLDVVETPPQLRTAIEGAAYYPAPPFKQVGVGRFYVTPTGNDPAALAENNVFALADLCAHEGFPGHDWHYQFMNAHARSIAPVRWLTPGGVEDSSSMWEDSVAAEGWALYAEALMAEPVPDRAHGFYSPEERIYQLQGQLMRDLRVRVDVGIHCGFLSYDEARRWFAEEKNFLPSTLRKKAEQPSAAATAAYQEADRALYRYAKWPTQAITYHLGKRMILELRARAQQELGAKFSARRFHEAFLGQGTIPTGYFAERLLQVLRG